MAAAAILDNFEWPYLRNGSGSTYIASRGHLCDSTAFLFIWFLHRNYSVLADLPGIVWEEFGAICGMNLTACVPLCLVRHSRPSGLLGIHRIVSLQD